MIASDDKRNHEALSVIATQLQEVGFAVQIVDWQNNVNENNGLGEWMIKSRLIHKEDNLIDRFVKLHSDQNIYQKIYLYDWVTTGISEEYAGKIQYDARLED